MNDLKYSKKNIYKKKFQNMKIFKLTSLHKYKTLKIDKEVGYNERNNNINLDNNRNNSYYCHNSG